MLLAFNYGFDSRNGQEDILLFFGSLAMIIWCEKAGIWFSFIFGGKNMPDYDKNALMGYIDEYMDDMIQDVVDLVSIPSISSDAVRLQQAMSLTLEKAAAMGFSAESLLDGRVGRVETGAGSEVVGLLAHLDVVAVEDDWTVDPFGGLVKDGMIWGRGSVDDKGPLMAALYAMKAVQSLNAPLQKKIQLIIGTQEEVTWTDLNEYVQKYPLPDYGFTPDGEFPLTNIEKGYCDIRLSFPLAETEKLGNCRIIKLEAGQVPNSIPSRAQAIISGEYDLVQDALDVFLREHPDADLDVEYLYGNIIVTAHGVMVHSSVPEKGSNAICLLCRFLDRLPLIPGGPASLVQMIARDFDGDIYGEKIGLYSDSEYLNGEYIHRNVISPTVMDTRDSDVRVLFNLRHSFGTNQADIEKAYQVLCEKYSCSQEVTHAFEPLYVSKDKPFIRIMTRVYEEISGLDGTPTIAMGTSYAKAMPNTVAWGPVFPGDEEFCHAADERISIERLKTAAKIYALALAEIVLTEDSLK